MKTFSTTAQEYVTAYQDSFSDPESQVTVTTLLHVANALDNDMSASLVTQYRYLLQTLETKRAEKAGPSEDPDALPDEFQPAFG